MSVWGGLSQAADPQKLDDSGEEEEEGSSSPSGSLHDVFWDRMILFLASTIIALSGVDILTELLRGGSQVACFFPDDVNVSDGQESFVTTFCSQCVPHSQHLPVFLLVHGILIAALHYVWRSSFSTRFNYFYSLASQLTRLNNDVLGLYPQKNVVIVTKLVSEFRNYKPSRILRWYQIKLLAQGVIAGVSVALTFVIFNDFRVNFNCPCPQDFSWPLPGVEVQCIFVSLRLFALLQALDVFLLASIILAAFGALMWSLWRHPTELGHKNEALFSFTTSIHSSYHVPKHLLRNPFSLFRSCCSKQFFRELSQRLIFPRLSTDLDFLLMMLYRTDSGLGHAFREGQVYEEHRQLTESALQSSVARRNLSVVAHKKDTQDLLKWTLVEDVYNKFVQFINSPAPLKLPDVIRGVVLGLAQLAPGNQRALDISFGSHGYSTVLRKVFRRVGSLNFDPTYKDTTTDVVASNFSNNILSLRCRDNILLQVAPDAGRKPKTRDGSDDPKPAELTHTNKLINELGALWIEGTEKDYHQAELVVVGPMDHYLQISTADEMLNKLKTRLVNKQNKKAILLTITPVSIEGKDATQLFYTYIPPDNLFDSLNVSVQFVVSDDNMTWPQQVPRTASNNDPQEGSCLSPCCAVQLDQPAASTIEHHLLCGNSLCKFKFGVYRFSWKPPAVTVPAKPANLPPLPPVASTTGTTGVDLTPLAGESTASTGGTAMEMKEGKANGEEKQDLPRKV